MSTKHAFLIIAHNQFGILHKLLTLLDDERNDIYVHIDKKVTDFDFEHFYHAKHSKITYLENRLSVNWAGYSQIQCELDLLKASVPINYAYYHLLSGVDLPIKTQDEIHAFFNSNQGKEFVCFAPDMELNRFHYYWPFCEKFTNLNAFERIITKWSRKFQSITHFRRNKRIVFRKGDNWFSITHDCAKYVTDSEKWIKRTFHHTRACDEVFLQTLLYNSPFYKNVFHPDMDDDRIAIMRYIDWTRGEPYVFRTSDYDDLLSSPYLFARKFDERIDGHIINMIYSHFLEV